MNILFFDTETTGLVQDWNDPSCDDNPRLVQLGMVLCDHNARVLRTTGMMIKPEGFDIPEEASNIHGITTEMAHDYGVPLELALGTFMDLMQKADRRVAHNLKFDDVVMRGELYRADLGVNDNFGFCTMLASTMIVGLKGKGNRPKWPKLCEAYQHFFGEEFKDAHDALVDVNGCKRIYFEGLKVKHGNLVTA